jgi:hypothetical protein
MEQSEHTEIVQTNATPELTQQVEKKGEKKLKSV